MTYRQPAPKIASKRNWYVGSLFCIHLSIKPLSFILKISIRSSNLFISLARKGLSTRIFCFDFRKKCKLLFCLISNITLKLTLITLHNWLCVVCVFHHCSLAPPTWARGQVRGRRRYRGSRGQPSGRAAPLFSSNRTETSTVRIHELERVDAR